MYNFKEEPKCRSLHIAVHNLQQNNHIFENSIILTTVWPTVVAFGKKKKIKLWVAWEKLAVNLVDQKTSAFLVWTIL